MATPHIPREHEGKYQRQKSLFSTFHIFIVDLLTCYEFDKITKNPFIFDLCLSFSICVLHLDRTKTTMLC